MRLSQCHKMVRSVAFGKKRRFFRSFEKAFGDRKGSLLDLPDTGFTGVTGECVRETTLSSQG